MRQGEALGVARKVGSAYTRRWTVIPPTGGGQRWRSSVRCPVVARPLMFRPRPLVVDLAVAAGAAVADVGGAAASAAGDPRGPQLSVAGVGLLLLAAVALVGRRRAPFVVSLVVGILTALQGIAEEPDPPLRVAVLVSLATVAALCGRRITVVAAIVAVLGSVVAVVLAADSAVDDYYAALVPSLAALALGDAYRVRLDLAGRRRAAEVDRAVSEERRRLARELHDVVAHHVSVMVVQAEAGAASAEADGDVRAVDAFDTIAGSGRTALVELRRVLGVLRDEEEATSNEPQPGIARLPALVERVRATGLPVELAVVGEPRAVADGIDVSAYRIVQEALTNVLRHSGRVPTSVELRWVPGSVEVSVTDGGDGSGALGDAPEGRGLLGIQERVALLEGEVRAGPSPEGGFAVVARLPTEPVARI